MTSMQQKSKQVRNTIRLSGPGSRLVELVGAGHYWLISAGGWWMVPTGAAGFMAAVVANEAARATGQRVAVLTSLGAAGSLVYTGAAIWWAFWFTTVRRAQVAPPIIPPAVSLMAAVGVGTQVVDAVGGLWTLEGGDLALDIGFAAVAGLLTVAFVIQALPTRLQGEGSGLVRPLWVNGALDGVWAVLAVGSGRWVEGAVLALIAVSVATVGYGIAATLVDEELVSAAG